MVVVTDRPMDATGWPSLSPRTFLLAWTSFGAASLTTVQECSESIGYTRANRGP